MPEMYKCNCGKEYKTRISVIKHCLKEKHYIFNKNQIKLFEDYPIEVKKALLFGDITFEEAINDVMFFSKELERLDIIKILKFTKKAIERIFYEAKIRYGYLKRDDK